MDHLGAEPHDQQQRFRGRIAEDFVTNVDAVGAGDLRRLMGKHRVCLSLGGILMGKLYGTVSRTAEGLSRTLTGPPQGCGMGQGQAKRGKRS
jgi:hypothetical protein